MEDDDNENEISAKDKKNNVATTSTISPSAASD
jgi:hypothetical protein